MITDERILGENFKSQEEYLTYLRHFFAYKLADEKISSGSSILEIGCGSGYGTKLLSKNAEKIIGLDVDKKTVEQISKKNGSEKCIFEFYDGMKIPYKDESFDAVVSFQVIEHIKDDKNIIKEISRVLRPGGILLMATPNRIFRLVEYGQKSSNKFHIREYSFREFKNLLGNAFSDINIFGVRGTDEVQKIEKNNVTLSLKITSIDPFDLRRFLPESLKHTILKIIKKFTANIKTPANDNFLEVYNLNNYYLISNNIDEEAIDLIAVCSK